MKTLTPNKISQLQRMFTAAQQARQSGLNSQAEGLYRDILKQAPEAWDVHHQLGILLATTSRAAEAAKHFRLIVKANPAYAPGHANLANALAESGELEEAVTEFSRALSLDNTLLGARIALGETLRRSTRYEEAVECFKEVLGKDKVSHAAFNGLGLVYRDMGNLPYAIECFDHAVGLSPQNSEYRMNFGAALSRFKLDDLASKQFYEAIKLRPDWLEAIVMLAEVLQRQRRYDEAKECLDRALELMPGNYELHERMGYVYLEMADTNQALQEFDHVLSSYPNRFMALLGVGRAHMEAGNLVVASSTFNSLISLFPDNPTSYYYFANSRKFKQDDPIIGQLKAQLDSSGDESRSAVALSFALGKIYDDCKNWDEAWSHYARGNLLRNQQYDYQPLQVEAKYNDLISVFTRDFMDSNRALGFNSNLPIIIIGMPRSGTTLTEQIISSHPQVIGAGEVVFWGHAWDAMPYTLGTDIPFPKCIDLLTPEKSLEIAQNYTSLLRKIAGPKTSSERITDKLPHNFVTLGLIALLFPEAPIIHCKRDAMDNCLSIFFQTFEGEHAYAYDLVNIGHHYKEYERLMAHWHAVLPDRIMDINYEDTIADPEYWSRKLIEHVGLEWNDACLAPHKLERTVKTASHWQVRQPIYKTSVQRWKNYEKYLGPLKETLGYKG